MKFDSYSLVARLFPAVICLCPFFLLHYFYLRQTFGQFWSELINLTVISDITFSLVLLFLLMQLSRYISKEFYERRIFSDGLHFPTTDYLLHINKYFSSLYKKKIHDKISVDFGIKIPSFFREERDAEQSRQIVNEAVTHIRAKVRKGNLLLQHNAEYGFVRNLAGGAIIALIMSVINVVVFGLLSFDKTALLISILLLLFYFSITVFAKRIITFFGHNYARVLIQEYMST